MNKDKTIERIYKDCHDCYNHHDFSDCCDEESYEGRCMGCGKYCTTEIKCNNKIITIRIDDLEPCW